MTGTDTVILPSETKRLPTDSQTSGARLISGEPLKGIWLHLARLVWLVIVGGSLAVFLVSVPAHYQELLTVLDDRYGLTGRTRLRASPGLRPRCMTR